MPTLREKMKQEMTLRGFALGTQENYLRAVIKLYEHFKRNPAKLSTEEVKDFLLTLANQPIAASTYNINIHGLKFFYEIVLDKPMVAIKLPRKREPQKLPDILSALEVERIIKATTNLSIVRFLFLFTVQGYVHLKLQRYVSVISIVLALLSISAVVKAIKTGMLFYHP